MELFKLFGTIAIQNADANEQIDDTTDRAKESENQISGAFKKIGTAVATYFAVDKIKDFGLNCINAAADANAASSQFTQVFGDMESQASKSLQGIADNTGIQVNRVKGSYTQIAAFAKTTGLDTSSALGLADRALVAVADSAAFYDRSLEETTESLQSFLKGNYENDAALGLSATETTRNAAANKLYGVSFNQLSEAQKQLTLLQMVEDANKASGALGQAARESDTWTNQMGNLKQAWTDFKAVLGDTVLPTAIEIVKRMTDTVQGLSEKVQNAGTYYEAFKQKIADAQNWCIQHQTGLTMVGIALGTVTTAVLAYNASALTKKALDIAETAQIYLLIAAEYAHSAASAVATAATTAFGAAVSFLTSPITLVIAAIGALIAVAVLLYQNWDTVKAKCIEIWGAVKDFISNTIETIKTVVTEKFNAVKEIVTNIFTSIKDTLSTIWETIKNVIQVAIMFIAELFTTAFELLTLPWQFIWENCKEYIFAAWEAIKAAVSNALDAIKTTISNVWNAIVAFLNPILERIKTAFTNNWNTIKNTITIVVNAIKNIVTTVWIAISSTISNVMNTIRNIIANIWNSIQSTVSSVSNNIKSVITNIFSAIQSTITNILNSIKSVFSSIWDNIKSTVSSVINGIKSTISSGLNTAKSTVSNVLESIKSKFSSIFDSAKNIVRNAIDTIKGFFNFSWSLPKLKLPHISISGEFSLKPPSVPHFGIEWYKKAMNNPMVLDSPTIFGYNPVAGTLLGGGEAGQEVVAGADTLKAMIREAVAAEQNGNTDKLIELLETLLSWLSNGGLRATLTEVLTKDVKLKWGGRELARLVRTYA